MQPTVQVGDCPAQLLLVERLDDGGEIWPVVAAVHNSRQKDVGGRTNAHADLSLLGKADGQAHVLSCECRSEPSRVLLIEEALQPDLGRWTDDEALSKKALEEVVGYSMVSRGGDCFGQSSHSGDQQQIRHQLHRRGGSDWSAVCRAGSE